MQQQEPEFYSIKERENYYLQLEQIKSLNLKVKQLKIDLKDMHTRLKRSEDIKIQSIYELERLEVENRLKDEENKELRMRTREQDQEIQQLRVQNAKLKELVKERALEENDFLLGVDESIIGHIDEEAPTGGRPHSYR